MSDSLTISIRHPAVRFVLLALGVLCLATAIGGGLVRMGWWEFSSIGGIPGIHGPLIVCGFLGTLFGLERAVTKGNFVGYVAPLLTAAGSVVLLFRPSAALGPQMVVAGSVAFLLLSLSVLHRKPSLHSLFAAMGSFQWVVGNAMWLAQWPVYNITLWWMSFVLLTVAGERLEIAQMMHLKVGPKLLLIAGLGSVCVGHVLVAVGHLSAPDSVMDILGDAVVDPRTSLGMKVAGAGMVIAAGWFLTFDPARTFLGRPRLSGYVAFCLVAGYVWLAVAGVLSIRYAGLVSGGFYGAFVHAFFLGFLMSVLFGHGPILIPSMLGLYLTLRKSMSVGPYLLQAGLLLQAGGGFFSYAPARQWGGMLSAAAILYFVVTLTWTLYRDNRRDETASAV